MSGVNQSIVQFRTSTSLPHSKCPGQLYSFPVILFLPCATYQHPSPRHETPAPHPSRPAMRAPMMQYLPAYVGNRHQRIPEINSVKDLAERVTVGILLMSTYYCLSSFYLCGWWLLFRYSRKDEYMRLD